MVANLKTNLNHSLFNHVGRCVLFMGRMTGRIYDYDPCSQMWLIKLDTQAAHVEVWAVEGQFEFIEAVR